MPRVVLIIQARMCSTRLPGKSMMFLAGAPLVGRILERVKRCQTFDEIVLALPDTEQNIPLKLLGEEYGVTVFSGSEDNLIERFYQAALLSQADFIARLPADNATPEPAEIDRIVRHHLSLGHRGFSTNLTEVFKSGYPDGIGAEIFDFSLLEEARMKNPTKMQREHIHLNFFDYSTQKIVDEKWCPVSTINCPVEFRRPDLVLDVNTKEQYELMNALYEYLYPLNHDFHITDTIKWYDNIYAAQEDRATDLIAND